MKGEDGEFCLRQDLRQIIAVKARIQCVAVDERAPFILKTTSLVNIGLNKKNKIELKTGGREKESSATTHCRRSTALTHLSSPPGGPRLGPGPDPAAAP